MPSIKFDTTLMRLIKDMQEVRAALRHVTTNLPLYDVANENTPASISASQNDYAPGNYDKLRLSSTQNINITGISGGKKGRQLQIFNVGSYSITLVHASTSSLAVNRFDFVNDSDFIIPPGGNALLYYDSTTEKWIGGDMSSIYDVVNEVTPSQITADQNNYDIGLAEVLRLSTDAERTITGFSGGVKGRSIRIFNVGSYPINISHQSTSSSAANRVISPTAFAAVIPPNGEVLLYYDNTTQRWLVSYTSNSNRISAEVRFTADYSVANATYIGLIWDSEFADTGNFWTLSNPVYFVIPETGWYNIECNVIWDANSAGFREIQLFESTLTKPLRWTSQTAVNGGQTLMILNTTIYATAGEQYGVEVWQNSGGALNVLRRRSFSSTYLYTRFAINKL